MNVSRRLRSLSVRTLTIKERLQVLGSEGENYYDEFNLIPTKLRPLLNSGKVLITNWHQFASESPHKEGDKTYAVVNKGDRNTGRFCETGVGGTL